MENSNNKGIFLKFWLFGLTNNILYVVILSAASDIIGPVLPKSIILLFDILPAFLVKLFAPFFVHNIHYDRRIPLLICSSTLGILLVSTRTLLLCLIGIVLASFSSGFGEITFLQLTHYFGAISLTGWSSGTGGAGIIGSFSYFLFTTILRLNIRISLLLYGILPFIFLSYYTINNFSSFSNCADDADGQNLGINLEDNAINYDYEVDDIDAIFTANNTLNETMKKLRSLVIPYMLPLATVYFAEYLINQAVAPTLLFPIDSTPFSKYRDIYVAYGTLYQLGVFISRTYGHKLPVKNIFIFPLLQFINLAIALMQSYYYITDSLWALSILMFYEGLIGGSAYVNCFLNILNDAAPKDREFILGSVSIADSFGTLIAALTGILLEPRLCGHQIDTGRPWCKME